MALVVAAVTHGNWSGQRTAGQAAQAPFASLVEQLSEPNGEFDTDNLISNEQSYLHVVPARHVRANREHGYTRAAKFLFDSAQGLFFDIAQHQLHALAREAARQREAQSARATGDHRHLVLELLHGDPSWMSGDCSLSRVG